MNYGECYETRCLRGIASARTLTYRATCIYLHWGKMEAVLRTPRGGAKRVAPGVAKAFIFGFSVPIGILGVITVAFGVISGLTHSANGTFLQRVAPAHATLIFIAAGLVMLVTAALAKYTVDSRTFSASLPCATV